MKLISELESNLNILENEKNSLNNKITELNIKLEYQEEKLSKNNNIVNNAQNGNNNILYKDISSQITKSKKIIDDMREKYDKEISDLKNDLNQFDLILKNNPFFNMNETERISILFKKEQVKFNETFRQQLKLLNEEVKKIKNVSQFDKNNLEIINKNFKKHTNDINMLEQSLKSWTQIAQILSKNYDKLKRDKFSDDKSSNNNFNNFNVEDNINKIQKYINNNKNDVYNLQLDVKEINEKTIPAIYKYINEQLKIKPSKFSQNIMTETNIKMKNISSMNKNNDNNFISINKNNDNNNNINNNFNAKTSKNWDDIASKIELMGSAAQNMNIKFNENKNNKENSSFSRSSNNLDKKEDNDLIKELGGENKNSSRNNENKEFEFDFDN